MKGIIFNYSKCDDLIKSFTKEKLEARWDSFYTQMKIFLEENGYSSSAKIDELLLSNAIIDYFYDIKRLKEFHGIERINSMKKIAYTSYWLLRRRPLQICGEIGQDDRDLATLNERFVLQYICNYLSVRERESHLFLRTNEGLKNFSGMLLYFLVYRVHDAHSLEMIIAAFLAGQIYESTGEDLSEVLHPYNGGE